MVFGKSDNWFHQNFLFPDDNQWVTFLKNETMNLEKNMDCLFDNIEIGMLPLQKDRDYQFYLFLANFS